VKFLVADCTPAMLTAAGVVTAADLPDPPPADGSPILWSADGRELSDGDTVTLPTGHPERTAA
jgi:hypothetical protein